MNQNPQVTESLKLKNICGLGLPTGQCPLLRKINGTNTLVCALKTYIDIGFATPNCHKTTQLEK